jgi:hypothetical protein
MILDWDVGFESNDVDILFTMMVIQPSRGPLDPIVFQRGIRLNCQTFLGMCQTCN